MSVSVVDIINSFDVKSAAKFEEDSTALNNTINLQKSNINILLDCLKKINPQHNLLKEYDLELNKLNEKQKESKIQFIKKLIKEIDPEQELEQELEQKQEQEQEQKQEQELTEDEVSGIESFSDEDYESKSRNRSKKGELIYCTQCKRYKLLPQFENNTICNYCVGINKFNNMHMPKFDDFYNNYIIQSNNQTIKFNDMRLAFGRYLNTKHNFNLTEKQILYPRGTVYLSSPGKIVSLFINYLKNKGFTRISTSKLNSNNITEYISYYNNLSLKN